MCASGKVACEKNAIAALQRSRGPGKFGSGSGSAA
jgi:hypothetical protein